MAESGERPLAQARRGLFELYRARGETVWIEAVGSSMLPSIVDGDWLLVQFGHGRPAIGEIVVFSLGGQIVVHRVVRRRRAGGTLVAKGDARLDFDAPVHQDQVLGIVRAVRTGADGPAVDRACGGARAAAAAVLSAAVADVASSARRLPAPLERLLLRLAARPLRIALGLVVGPGGRGG